MASRNHISFSMVSLAVIALLAIQETALADKLSPFCQGLPADNVPFCSQVTQGETIWKRAILKMLKATFEKTKSAKPAVQTIGASLPATIPEADRANIAEKCKSGLDYALHNLYRSLKRIRRGVYARTDDVVYAAWAGIYECSGALQHFKVAMNAGPFKIQDEAEKAIGACHGAVSKAMDAGGLIHPEEAD